MTHPIDTAYVDIVPVDKSLERLQRDIDKTMKKIDKEAEKDLKKIDKNFENTFKSLDKQISDMEKMAEAHFKELEKIVDSSFDAVDDRIEDSFTTIDRHFTKFSEDSDNSFKKTRAKFLEPLSDGLRAIGGVVADLGRSMFQLVSGIGGAVSSNPLISLVLVLTPAIIALAAALSQLIGLVGILPAGFGVLLAAVLPVVVAFQNFGDAVSALADGDVDKINEAMKKLSPSAQSVAREIAALLPMLRSFQRVVQEGFFAPLVGDFTNVVRSLFPALEKGFFDVSRAMGRLTSSFAELAAAPKTFQTIQTLFATTSRIITELTGPFRRFADMLLNTVIVGLPYVERLSAAFGRALDSFSAFVNASIEDGSFNTFVEEAITTVKELIALAKALGGLLGTIFGATEEEGHNFLKTLTDLTIKLDEFLKTAEGQAALDALVFAVKALGFALMATLNTLIFFWNVTQNTLKGLEMLGRGFVDLVKKIGEWLGKVPEAISNFIGGIPQTVADIFQSMIDRALQIIGIGTGLILFAIQVLPGKIVDFLGSIPERIGAIMARVGPIIASALQTAVDFGWNIITTGFNTIVDFVLSVPDRLAGLIPNFSKAGKNLIESFMNGFRAVGSFIGDVAGDIVGAVKGFLNKAIDKINSGIQIVDDVLPGSLGRIPRLAEGALVRHRPGGIMANIGEGSEDEVVAPLSKLEGMFQGGETINFGPGAISIVFGSVPTESEARQVGQSVGHGIIDAISRRNMRAQVRAI